jgi:hypothetical protein
MGEKPCVLSPTPNQCMHDSHPETLLKLDYLSYAKKHYQSEAFHNTMANQVLLCFNWELRD